LYKNEHYPVARYSGLYVKTHQAVGLARIRVALPPTRTTRGKKEKTDNREEVLPHRFNGNRSGENAYEEVSDSCRRTLVE
jgi:hypothetical protein